MKTGRNKLFILVVGLLVLACALVYVFVFKADSVESASDRVMDDAMRQSYVDAAKEAEKSKSPSLRVFEEEVKPPVSPGGGRAREAPKAN